MKKGWWKTLALIIASIGAFNWGMVGLANVNLVTAILGTMPMVVTIIYIAIGISGIIAFLKAVKVIN